MKKKISRRVAIIRLLILDVKPLLVVLFLLGKKHIKLSKFGSIDKDISFIRLFSDGSCLLHLSKSLRSSKSAQLHASSDMN
jgi:hypothetical protein